MHTADDYLNMDWTQLSELECAAYASGDTERAALLEALAKLSYRDGTEAAKEQPHDQPTIAPDPPGQRAGLIIDPLENLPMTPENLKAWRARLGLGDTGMAAYLGVPLGTLRKWENGTRTPDTAPLRLFAVLQLIEAQAPELHAAILAAAKAGAGAQDAPQRARKGRGRVTGAPGPENAPAARESASEQHGCHGGDGSTLPVPWIHAADALPAWMATGKP